MYVRPEIAAMSGYAPGEQPQVGKVIKLNTNENPYPPSPAAVRAIQQAAEQSLARYPDPMGTAFRARAADLFGVEPDWILCGNGSDDILTIVTRACVGHGQLLRLPYPSYILYKTLAELQGARAEEVPFNPDWTLPDAFTAPADDLKLAFLPNPNSPTGTVLSPEAVLALAERLPCPLLVDEAYADFAETNCVDLVRRRDNILVSRTLSKSYALAGLRFGFLIGSPDIVRELIKVKDSYNCDALSLAGATAAIHDQDWLARNHSKILAGRGQLVAGLQKLGFEVLPSQANFVWCEHPARPAKTLYEQLKAQGVLVRYMNYPKWRDGLRITVGAKDQIDVLLQLLSSMV